MIKLEDAQKAAKRAVMLFPASTVKLRKAKDGHYYVEVLYHTPLPDYTYDFTNLDDVPVEIRYEAKIENKA